MSTVGRRGGEAAAVGAGSMDGIDRPDNDDDNKEEEEEEDSDNDQLLVPVPRTVSTVHRLGGFSLRKAGDRQ